MKTGKKLLLIVPFLFLGCDPDYLTQGEIVQGLKSALEVGTDYALKTLGKEDGFLLDQAVKIGLPEDAAKFLKQAATVPIVNDLVKGLEDQLILTINRAAEVAVQDVVPIFLDAITDITIEDAKTILFSSNDYAATHYLKSKTYNKLSETCISIIQDALNKKIVGIVSAQEVWGNLMTVHNRAAQLVPLLNWEPIDPDLSQYTTQKALDGVFLKIGDEEQKIRTDVNARVNDILRKVFGQLD
ncbi:MAG: DUF4197 domain-containing protein [Bacteroidetes bacterium]|nr:DUF4197 domain-containing protein [Bacteroidota bacterium]